MFFMTNLHSKRCRVYFEDQWGIWGGQWNDQIYTLGSYSGRSIFQYRKVLENYLYQKFSLFFFLINTSQFFWHDSCLGRVQEIYYLFAIIILFPIWPYVSPWIDSVQIVETFVWVAYNSDDLFGVIYDWCSFT